MRQESKVVEILTSATATQMETALNNHLNTGWELKTIFLLGTKTYAILVKTIAS